MRAVRRSRQAQLRCVVVRDGDAHAHAVVLRILALLDVLPGEEFFVRRATLGVTTNWSVISHLDGQGSKSKTGGINVGVFLNST